MNLFYIFVLYLSSVLLFATAAKDLLPVSAPLCVGNGSMFGYAVAMVKYKEWVWLAVGRPWDCAVDIFRTSLSNLELRNFTEAVKITSCKGDAESSTVPITATPASTATSCFETTTTTTAFRTPTPSSFNWQRSGLLADPTNLTYTGRDWLGIGDSSPMSLFGYDVEFSSTGEWIAVGVPGRSFTKFSDLPVKHISWHPYHGSVIIYRNNTVSSYSFFIELSVKDAGMSPTYFDRFGSKVQFSNDPLEPFLFISSNGGWDGVSAPGKTTPDKQQIIFGEAAVQKIWPALPTRSNAHLGVFAFKYNAASQQWKYVDFIAAKSPVPLGMLGIDFTVDGSNNTNTILAIRDYRPSSSTKPGGIVALYQFNVTTNTFTETDVLSAASFGSTSDWTQEDFFGVGLSLASKVMPVLHIGAPGSSQIHRLIKQKERWELDAVTYNPGITSKSFFGGFLTQSDDSRFILVSNAVTSQGPGEVYVHHRKVPGYDVAELEEEFPSASNGFLSYSWIATLKKSNKSISGFKQDHFGKDVAVAGPWIVVGAPVEGCIYTYVTPLSYTLTPGLDPSGIIKDLTGGSQVNYGLYIGIGIALAFLIIVPLIVYVIIRRHKRKMLTQFALADAKNVGSPPGPEPK